jgi:hypothetical protein
MEYCKHKHAKFVVGKPERKRPFGRPKSGWEDKSKAEGFQWLSGWFL